MTAQIDERKIVAGLFELIAQAERVESQLREDIYNRRYGQGKTMGLSDFFDNNYLSWLKENRSASAYRDALSRGKELKAFFKNQPVREISTRDCERFKSMLGKAETLRNELRSGSTLIGTWLFCQASASERSRRVPGR